MADVLDSNDVKVTTPLEEKLDPLSRDELGSLALRLIERSPDMVHLVEDISKTDDFSFLVEY